VSARFSGQALLLAVIIFSLLILSVPLIIYVTRTTGLHHAASAKQSKGQAIAEEGIAHTMKTLSSPAPWTGALQGSFPADWDGATQIQGVQGGLFTLDGRVVTDAFAHGRAPFQVQVIATAFIPPQTTPAARLQAVISRRTLGARLESTFHADAALELTQPPNVAAGTLKVHWGPIVCISPSNASPWILVDPLDTVGSGGSMTPGYPRKFYGGGITGAGGAYPRSPAAGGEGTDHKEYWAYKIAGVPVFIDSATYQGIAAWENDLAVPGFSGSDCIASDIARHSSCGANNCGYFVVKSGCSAVFDNSYPLPAAGTVLYVDGDVTLQNTGMDLWNGGALISTGVVTLGTRGVGAGIGGMMVNVPETAPLEYPYYASVGRGWPCKDNVGDQCQPSTAGGFDNANINFRGFLWARGGLRVTATNWMIAGAVLVGDIRMGTGSLDIGSGGGLTVLYDERIAHRIVVTTVDLEVDRLTALSK
jgi:hypothetical protein